MRRRVELPDDSTIKRWKLDEKLTYQQMVERWYEMTDGRELAKPAAFAMRCSRNGWTKPQKQSPLIPWVLEERHKMKQHAAMLRYEWKRQLGETIPPDKLSNVHFFFRQRAEKQTVIHYEPNSQQGFWDIPREWFDATDALVRDPDLMPLSGTPDPGTPAKRKSAITRAKKSALV